MAIIYGKTGGGMGGGAGGSWGDDKKKKKEPAKSPTTLGVGGSRAPVKTPPTYSTPATPIKSTTQTYTAPKTTTSAAVTPTAQNTNTVIETEKPDWIPDGPSGYSGGGGGNNNKILDTIDDYYAEQSRQVLKNLRSAYDTSRANYEAQKPGINQYADQMRNQVDTNYYQAMPELWKAMEAGGQRGGENITGTVGLNTTRQQGANDVELYRANQLQNLTNTISGLDTQQAADEATALSSLNADVFGKRLSALQSLVSQQEADEQQARADIINTIGAYANDYQARVNQLQNDNDTSNDWIIPYLLQAREEKKATQAAAAEKKAQNDFDNRLALLKAAASGGSDTNAYMTKDQAYYQDLQQAGTGSVSPATIQANAMQLIAQYGIEKYNAILKEAQDKYNPSRGQLGVADFRILAGEQ